jgi:hypothetical protein
LETIQREQELAICGRGYKMLLDNLSKPNNIQSGGAAMRPQSMERA